MSRTEAEGLPENLDLLPLQEYMDTGPVTFTAFTKIFGEEETCTRPMASQKKYTYHPCNDRKVLALGYHIESLHKRHHEEWQEWDRIKKSSGRVTRWKAFRKDIHLPALQWQVGTSLTALTDLISLIVKVLLGLVFFRCWWFNSCRARTAVSESVMCWTSNKSVT